MQANKETKKDGHEEVKRLYRSKVDRVFAGVCGGFAEYLNIDVAIIRVIWLIMFFINGVGLLLYFICLIAMKENPEQRSADRKKPQNVSLYWGVGLVLLGLVLLSPHWRWDFLPFHPFQWLWFDPWFFNWDTFWPLVIILFGVLYLVHVLRQSDETETGADEMTTRLYRSRTDRVIGGVCGGLGNMLKIDPVIIRVGWVILTLATTILLGVIVYIVWMIVVPEEPREVKVASKATAAPKTPAKKTTPKRVKKMPEKKTPDQDK